MAGHGSGPGLGISVKPSPSAITLPRRARAGHQSGFEMVLGDIPYLTQRDHRDETAEK